MSFIPNTFSPKKWFAKKNARTEESTSHIPTGRVTEASGNKYGTLSPYMSRTTNILRKLRGYREESEAIDFLRKVSPDVSMAVWNFLRLANQGHEMHFYDLRDKNKRLSRAEAKWREFAEKVGQITNAGLDGVIDQIHASAFLRGAMGAEAEVTPDLTGLEDIHPVIPQTIHWKAEERDGRTVWIPYQQQSMKMVSLEPGKANFFWVPTDPDIDDPRGTLLLSPVLQSIDFQMQILQDLQAVLHHQGWPRNDIKILMERTMAAMSADVKANVTKQKQWLSDQWNEIVTSFRALEPDSDYIHFDDIEINMNQGANAGRSLDVRAIMEMVDTQVLNGMKQLGTFVNRHTGRTETYSTVEMKIYVQGIISIQRGSKRLLEEVARLWLRVNAIQGIPVFTHNTIDWQSEIDKWTVAIMKERYYGNAQGMGWVSPDEAASAVVGKEKAHAEVPTEQIPISFGNAATEGSQDEYQDTKDLAAKDKALRPHLGIVK